MNGEVKTYKLNEPMTWKEFKKMPDELRREYISGIEQRFNAPRTEIAKMFDVSYGSLRAELAGLGFGVAYRGKSKCEELEKAKIELEMAQKEVDDLHDLLVEAKAIKRTLYVVFGRQFDDECYVACGGGIQI